MALNCAECNKPTYKAVETETDAQGHSFVLLECEKCARCIIVPKEEWEKSGS